MKGDLCKYVQSFIFTLMQAIPMFVYAFLIDGISVQSSAVIINKSFKLPVSLGRGNLDITVTDYLD